MKNIFKIILIFVITSCKAQNPIINIEGTKGEHIPGAYFRDTNNLLDPFIGTYIYTDGATTLKIILKKKVMFMYGDEYQDLLIGEYQYIKNGVEKINTLNNLDPTFIGYNSIEANQVLKKGSYQCFDCSPNEIRIGGSIVESSTHNTAELIIGKVYENLQPAIKITMWWRTKVNVPGVDPAPMKASFPSGEYVLIKQP